MSGYGAGSEVFPKRLSQNLSDIRFWKFTSEVHVLWNLVSRERFARVRYNVLSCQRRILANNKQGNHLTGVLICLRYSRSFQYARMRNDCCFNFVGINVEA